MVQTSVNSSVCCANSVRDRQQGKGWARESDSVPFSVKKVKKIDFV